MVHAFLDAETRKALSPLAALITGALSQVESTIELTNRIYDSVFDRSLKTTDSANKVFQSSFQDRLSSYNAFCAEAKAADATVTCAFTN